ncbi:MAG: alpha/beta hydrolase [Chloroflexi bacterium]|nr:alpha/beta hydrolase [Chloroflexota bacterium]MBV9595247.1 alpha/beta hydrolase [Chloroflexota bacterium]
MPTIERAGATIYYEDHGDPSLPTLFLLAPGGLNSTIDFWSRNAIKPLEVFAGEFRIIGMDQRNAGSRSKGPLESSDPWRMYAQDQLAVLDHLGVDKTLVIGCCIGSSFIFELLKIAPERVVAAVPMQPIGHDDTNAGQFGPDMWRPWGQNLIDKGASFSMDEVDAFGRALFDSGFVFTATRDELKSFQTPMLLMYGNDRAHPRGVSVEVGKLLPNVQIIEEWKDAAAVPQAVEHMRTFLRSHQLVSAR